MNEHDRDRERDPDAPDPSQDSWSAWLPQLDGPATPGSPTTPGSSTTPLPQASGPSTGADPVPPAVPPAPPLPYAVTPPWAGPPRVGPPPTTYFGWAVVCAIFCFMPLGIVAVVKSLQVKPRWAQGDWIGAEKAARAAKTWCLVAAAIWPGSALLFSCLGALGGGRMFMHF
ncbi:hypothetical protein GCM10027039_24940 [Terrabacter koreensis]